MKKIDAKGMACPLPVIQTKKALANHEVVETIVDNKIATQNLEKLATQLGYSFEMNQTNEQEYRVRIGKSDEQLKEKNNEEQESDYSKSSTEYIVVINTQVMGNGSDELGTNLLKAFLYSLSEQDVLPKQVIFYNGGVHFVAEDLSVLETLQNLAAEGVELYACGACLDYYGLTEKVVIGEITNMYRIVEMMRLADKIVQP